VSEGGPRPPGRRELGLLLGVLVLAGALRLVGLDAAPPGPYVDEVAVAVEARSVAATGRDTYGRRLPLFFRALDDYKAPAYLYAVAAWGAATGADGVAGARTVAALFGLASLVGAWWLGREALGSGRGGLLVAGLLAVSPWHLQFSRQAWQAIVLVAVQTVAAAAILRGIRRREGGGRSLTLGAGLLGLGLYAYSPAKLWVPLFALLALGALFAGRATWPGWGAAWARAGAVLALVGLPFAVAYLAQRDAVDLRFRALSLLGEPGWPRAVARAYLEHLSPRFLFVAGDPNLRHSAPGVGQLLWPLAALVPLGAARALGRRAPADWLVLGWLLAAPLLAAFTRGAPHATRTLAILPAPQLLAAAGVLALGRWAGPARRRLVLWATAAVLAAAAAHATWTALAAAPRRPDVRAAWRAGVEAVVARAGELQGARRLETVHFLPGTGAVYVDWIYVRRLPPARLHAHAERTRAGATERYDPFDVQGAWGFLGARFPGRPGPGSLVVQGPGDRPPTGGRLLGRLGDARFWALPRGG